MNAPANVAPVDKEAEVKVTKTAETAKILNYNCTKYIVEVTDKGNKINQIIWATPDIKDIDFKTMAKQKFGKGQRIYFDKIDGVALKIEMKMPEAGMTMQVTEIKREPLNAADFAIPADFKEVPGMFR